MNNGSSTVTVVRRPAPGRVRLKAPGLYRRPQREIRVERAVGSLRGVRQARASALTGNVLVLFDPQVCDEEAILAEVGEALAIGLDSYEAAPPSRDRGQVAGGSPAVARSPRTERGVGAEISSAGPSWHAMEAAEVASRLGVDTTTGLPAATAAARLRQYGPNRLPQPDQPSFLKLVLQQVTNPTSALLAVGAVLSVATGGIADAILIGTVLIASATIGAATENSGNKGIAALRKSFAIKARVRRDGQEETVDAGDLVPGDVIKLLPGDPVPADARLTYTHRVQVEESALTGESRAVDKDVAPVDARSPLADRACMVYRGTTTVTGHAEAIVVSTGSSTVVGGLQILAARAQPPPGPLERDLDSLAGKLALATVGICTGVFGLAVLRGSGVARALATAISLGVAAIPEGLSANATTVLALGAGRMQKKGILIRTLGAAETLGAVTVVCADKTGTITENRMAAREWASDGRVVSITGPALSPVGTFRRQGRQVSPARVPGLMDALRIGALCNDAEVERMDGNVVLVNGSATEGALLVAAMQAGMNLAELAQQYPRLDSLDRGNGRRYMVTVHRGPEGLVALAKGSPEEVLGICSHTARSNGFNRVVDLGEEARQTALGHNAAMATRGLRVLGLAEKRITETYDDSDLSAGFIWRGLIGLEDPIRAAVPATIDALHRAGIRTIMITGDQAYTASAVAQELRLSRRGSQAVLEAGEMSSLPRQDLRERVANVGIFARVPPEMKLAVVEALQQNGEVVSMTGDGVNDAPALRAADVGVAMGERGTELARELADVVLATDNFSHMVDAVEEGRLVRVNVRKVLHYLLTTNATEVFTVLGAVAVGLPSPLSPMQLLWINIVSDLGPAVGLATEPAPADLMAQPPRDPREPMITPELWQRMGRESAAISLGAIGTYALGLIRHGPGPVASNMAFASLMGGQLLHVPLARRYGQASGAPAPRNSVLGLGVACSALLGLAAVFFPPLRNVLGGARFGLADALITGAGTALPIAAIGLANSVSAGNGQRHRGEVSRRYAKDD